MYRGRFKSETFPEKLLKMDSNSSSGKHDTSSTLLVDLYFLSTKLKNSNVNNLLCALVYVVQLVTSRTSDL